MSLRRRRSWVQSSPQQTERVTGQTIQRLWRIPCPPPEQIPGNRLWKIPGINKRKCTHACIDAFCVHVCTYAHAHSCIHAGTHTCIHTGKRVGMHTYIVCIHAYMDTYMHACMHTGIQSYIPTYLIVHESPIGRLASKKQACRQQLPCRFRLHPTSLPLSALSPPSLSISFSPETILVDWRTKQEWSYTARRGDRRQGGWGWRGGGRGQGQGTGVRGAGEWQELAVASSNLLRSSRTNVRNYTANR